MKKIFRRMKRRVTRYFFFARSNLFVPAGSLLFHSVPFFLPRAAGGFMPVLRSPRCSKIFILSFAKTVFIAFYNPTRGIISKTQGRGRYKHEQI